MIFIPVSTSLGERRREGEAGWGGVGEGVGKGVSEGGR